MKTGQATRITATITMLLGLAAILLPYLFGTLAVSLLGLVVLLSGAAALWYARNARLAGFNVSVLGPWTQVIAGGVLMIWPGLALWLVAVILGGSFILNGIMGLMAYRDRGIELPKMKKFELWLGIGFGVLMIILGAAGSAILFGIIIGLILITMGLQQWRFTAR